MSILRIREMRAADAGAVAALSGQLGYEATTAEIVRRFATLQETPENGLFVAVGGTEVLGWIHAYGVRLLETDGYAEIGGLVVTETVRRRGVGRRLLRRAEAWAAAHGYGEVRLRSGLHRKEAHVFYQKVGYELSKASYMFRKPLSRHS